jgi:riboflavin transporter FmnP
VKCCLPWVVNLPLVQFLFEVQVGSAAAVEAVMLMMPLPFCLILR